MDYLNIYDVMNSCGVRNRATIYAQIRKGHLKGDLCRRTDGGLWEWRFESAEVHRFAAWFKVTPRLHR